MPDKVLFVDELPRTATGKVRKTSLRETFADAWEAGSTDNIGAVCVYFGDEPERR